MGRFVGLRLEVGNNGKGRLIWNEGGTCRWDKHGYSSHIENRWLASGVSCRGIEWYLGACGRSGG
jgi:hypothetical protein